METLFINANKLTRDPSIAPLVGGGFAVGYVDEIHGEGGVEIESFNPTRHEVLQLVKHYAQAILHIKWGWLTMDCVGSSDRRERNFAIARIEQIRTCIGTTLVESVMDEVCSESVGEKLANGPRSPTNVWHNLTKNGMANQAIRKTTRLQSELGNTTARHAILHANAARKRASGASAQTCGMVARAGGDTRIGTASESNGNNL